MATEVTVARESKVNPLNSQRRASTPARVPNYDHRYEVRGGGNVGVVRVEEDLMNPGKTKLRLVGRSSYDEDYTIGLSNAQIQKLASSVSRRKDSTISLPKGKDYKSVTLSYDSKSDEVTYEKRPKDENAWITTVRVPADAFRNMKTKSR